MTRWLVAVAMLLGACSEPRAPGVVLWHAYTGLERDALEQTAATWNAAHPNEPLTLVAVPYDAFADKLTSAIPGGNGPDLFIYPHDRIGDWSSAGVIEPIEYWVDDARAQRFSDDAIAAMAYRGSLWGLPLATKSLALYYRTDLVDHAPASTDELVALAPKMHASGGFALAYANVDLYGHAAWLHGFGGRVMTDDDDARLAIASPDAATAMQFARRLVADGVVPADAQGPLVASLFNEGRAATVMSGPWFVADIAKGVPWKVATLPVVSATGQLARPFLGVEGILMSARARDKDLAFAVMDALTSDAQAITRARTARQVVANVHAYDEPDIATDTVLAAFRAQRTVTMPKAPGMRMVWTPYRTALGEVLAGRADAASQLLGVEREVRRYMEGAK